MTESESGEPAQGVQEELPVESRMHLGPDGSRRLLVIAGGMAELHPLPSSGEVRIGPGADCDLRLNVDEVLPTLVLSTGREPALRVVDDGDPESLRCFIGGRPLAPGETARLVTGAVVTVGTVSLVLQVGRSQTRLRQLRNHEEFCLRRERERVRSETTGSDLSVITIVCSPGGARTVEPILEAWLAPTDVIALRGPDELEALLIGAPIEETRRLRDALDARFEDVIESIELESLSGAPNDDDRDPPSEMDRLGPIVKLVAESSINVLLLGETGVGKDVMANRIHHMSGRSGPLVSVNCGALHESLLESELFGHEKGAFTGSVGTKIGLIESANGGSLFLDEAGDMPPSLQARLLRVLEQRQVTRIGATRPRNVDVRFIAATNRDLERDIADKLFRQDLYYRLAGTTISIPPLRQRRGEILGLAQEFLAAWCLREGVKTLPDISPRAEDWLLAYSYPGNCRELKNIVEHAALVCRGKTIEVGHLPETRSRSHQSPAPSGAPVTDHPPFGRDDPRSSHPPLGRMPQGGGPVDPAWELDPSQSAPGERAHGPGAPVDGKRDSVIRALEDAHWNQTQAAKLLGVSRRTLIKRIEAYSLPRPRKKSPA